MNLRGAAVTLLVLAASSPSSEARADETPAHAAERLFNEGNALADVGNFAAACERYSESNRLEPAIGTQFNLADC
jgi:outer membrane protein assembly factor BamD (BamD/ComL family)